MSTAFVGTSSLAGAAFADVGPLQHQGLAIACIVCEVGCHGKNMHCEADVLLVQKQGSPLLLNTSYTCEVGLMLTSQLAAVSLLFASPFPGRCLVRLTSTFLAAATERAMAPNT